MQCFADESINGGLLKYSGAERDRRLTCCMKCRGSYDDTLDRAPSRAGKPGNGGGEAALDITSEELPSYRYHLCFSATPVL